MKFDRSRPFENWARGVARRVALANLRKRGRQTVLLDESVLDSIGEELDKTGDEAQMEFRKQMLQGCLQRLSARNRELVRLRYFENQSYADISSKLGRSIGALYVVFNRIHRSLGQCVEKGLRSA